MERAHRPAGGAKPAWPAVAAIVLGTTVLGTLLGAGVFGLGYVAWSQSSGEPLAWEPIEAAKTSAVLAAFAAPPALLTGLYLAIRFRAAGSVGWPETIAAAGVSPLAAGAIAHVLGQAGATFLMFHIVAYTVFAPVTIPVAIVAAAIGRPILVRLLGLEKR